MKVFPMIFLFCSGSITVFKFETKISVASKYSTFIFASLNLLTTSSASFFRSKPLLTNKQIKFSFIALFIKAAVTDESTPPEIAHKTLLSPT